MKKNIVLILILGFLFGNNLNAQGFLRAEGKQIVNENGDPYLLRGMGLGGWMVQEGYMLQTAEFAGPQHKIKAAIKDVIGEEALEEFYNAWLTNNMQKVDVDSLASWGFNSIRLPMHYNLFTLPIEDEPVEGENTWLEKGFELTDNIIEWCKANDMYVILDLHAAPGGQGYDAAISDYDDTKPSLWESSANRNKTVALWKRIAERYKDEPTIAGYDLLNEPNWDLPGGSLLKSLYQQITTAIRQVDQTHIIFIEGNWFANDFTGLTPPWDDNLVYSPHKYWSTNDQGSIQWVLNLRNQHNVPLYLGESGENGNVWFRDAIKLLEDNNIGWAWWPMKKVESVAGPLSVTKTDGYQRLLNYWKGSGPKPSQEEAIETIMKLADDYKMENCRFQKDVIDAMFRQVQEDESKPFAKHMIPGIVMATDFDLGTNGIAYEDSDVANYSVSTGTFTSWNTGWNYRNDGVDIERSEDTQNTNGYNVGWTNAGEWIQYTVDIESDGIYDLNIRNAAGDFGGLLRFTIDDIDITSSQIIPYSGGYQDWQTTSINDVILEAGTHQMRIHIDAPGYNLGSFEFEKTGETSDVDAAYLSGYVTDNDELELTISKGLKSETEVNPSDFRVLINGGMLPATSVEIDNINNRKIILNVDYNIVFTDIVKVSYNGADIPADDETVLGPFGFQDVQNLLPAFVTLPTKIEAEDYVFQSGFQLESTEDIGGGQNIGFLDVNDFADYNVYVPNAGLYELDFRTASQSSTGGVRLDFLNEFNGVIASKSFYFPSTGGWQNWTTNSATMVLPEGYFTMRMTIIQAPFNMNWMNFDFLTNTESVEPFGKIQIYPNPNTGRFSLEASLNSDQEVLIRVMDINGKELTSIGERGKEIKRTIDLSEMGNGIYLLQLIRENGNAETRKIIVSR